MSSIQEMQNAIQAVRYNPAAIQRYTLDTLKEVHQGDIDLVDATNPFVFLMTSSAVHASAAMTEAANLTRQQYPSLAQTEDELYLHMSDRDFLGRFATPSRTHFSLLLHKDELIQRAVPVDEGSVRKIVIPRHTEFTVSDYTFTLQYPIELRVMGHGGIQVVYDVSEPSPLQTIESNLLDWTIVTLQREEYLRIEVPVEQMALTSHLIQLNQASSYRKTFTLADHYYYCRVWRADSDGRWKEIKTTHTDQVFDPFDPTVLLKVYKGKLQVSVPNVYIATGLLTSELRIDIYTTKGPLDLILESYPANAFMARWRDVSQSGLDRYTAPLANFGSMTVFSDAVVSGGSLPLSFEELRERVIMNAVGNASLPITNHQMVSQLNNKGYTPILDVDNVTNRIYLASRQLPAPSQETLQSPLGSRFGSLQATFKTLVNFTGVIDNQERVTITPNTLFKETNGVVGPLNNQARQDLEGLTGEMFLSEVNNGHYFFSPFHYVLDTTGRYFASRPYYLEQPQIRNRQFIQENDSLELTLSTRSLKVEKHPFGYRIVMATQSGDSAKEMPDEAFRVQLGITPQGETKRAYLLGELVGLDSNDERIYQFDIHTNFDINERHGLTVTNLRMGDNEVRPYQIDLFSDIDVFYYARPLASTQSPRFAINDTDGRFQIPDSHYGLVHERTGVRFGRFLEGFWNNSRSVLDAVVYDRYAEDVLAYHEANVYRRDPHTGHIDISLDSSGNVVYEILHHKDDPVLDSEGNHVIRHQKGDVKVDHDGNPIVVSNRDVIREADIFLLDGRYFFADHEDTLGYLHDVPRKMEAWLLDDIRQFRSWALEQTEIFLYPRQTVGMAKARVRENEEYYINLEQSFTVTYYLGRDRYQDNYLREVLIQTAQEVLARRLTERRVTVSGIVSELTTLTTSDVIALKVEGLGGKENLSALTLERDTNRCSIRKRLTRTLDGQYAVENDVSVVFLRHEDQ